jgi:AGZA family xanthine/uracil permease-like MFS transporter
MKWMTRGDVDGFFGLAIDNLVQLLVIDALCRGVLGFPVELVHGRILPGAAVSLLVGNLYYARQALALARRTGRTDVCALPYGINTVSLFAYVFLVMLPAKLAAEAAGAADPATVAWQAGLVACVGSGIIELAGSLVAERIRKSTPRAALLSTLAGIALTFIALGFLFLTTLGVVMLVYFGRVRFRGGLPGGLVAVGLGTALAWFTGLAPVGALPQGSVAFHPPIPVFAELFEALRGNWLVYFSVILPMGLFNVIGSLQNIESAEAAGDSFPTRPALAVNGLGTLAAALFGSCFPTTIYIGHPGWKAMGARIGYSWLNGAVMALLCVTGAAAVVAAIIPIEAGMAIVLWIGIVIGAQAFQATPIKHAPAVIVGLLPGIAGWGAQLIKTSLRAAGLATAERPFSPDLLPIFARADIYLGGAFALEQGQILSAMLLAAMTVFIIERQFAWAGACTLVAAAFSWVGLMHSYRWMPSDTVLHPGWGSGSTWATGYLLLALLFYWARWNEGRTNR